MFEYLLITDGLIQRFWRLPKPVTSTGAFAMVLTLEELNEAYSKSQRLLESLTQIPTLLADDEAWANERRSAFASLRRGLVDCITNGCLEAPIFGNRPIEDAFVFLLTLGLRSERRRDNVLLCFKCLRNSESWSLVLRGSRRCLELLKELPESFREDVLDAADASELLLLIAQSKKKKKKKSSKAAASVEIADSPDAAVPSERHQAPKEAGPLDLSPERAPEPARQSDFLAETSVSDSGVEVPKASQSCPEDLLAENSLSVSDSGVDMPKASRTCPQDLLAENSLSVSDSGADAPKLCPEDLLTEPSLSLSIHSPEPPQAPPTSPALPSAALQRPPRPCSMNIPTPTGPTPTRLRNFGGMAQQSPASKPRRPGSRKKDFEELGPRCPNGKPMTREMMIKEGQKRREDGSRTPTLRRLLSRGASSPPSGADTPSSILGRMKQKLLPSRATTPSPASRMSRTGGRDFGGGDRFGVSKKE